MITLAIFNWERHLEQIVEIIQTLTQLPQRESAAQLLGQLDPLADRIQCRIEHIVFTLLVSVEGNVNTINFSIYKNTTLSN